MSEYQIHTPQALDAALLAQLMAKHEAASRMADGRGLYWIIIAAAVLLIAQTVSLCVTDRAHLEIEFRAVGLVSPVFLVYGGYITLRMNGMRELIRQLEQRTHPDS